MSILGIVAGWLAERITGRNHGLLTNFIVGILGAIVSRAGDPSLAPAGGSPVFGHPGLRDRCRNFRQWWLGSIGGSLRPSCVLAHPLRAVADRPSSLATIGVTRVPG
jgi:hypothetical protein